MISFCTIILIFVQIPRPDVHMNNLEKCFYHVLKNLILLHKNTRLLKKCEHLEAVAKMCSVKKVFLEIS